MFNATLLPGRTPRGSGSRYRRRDGIFRSGGRCHRPPAQMHAIASQAGRHLSSPRQCREQRVTHLAPGKGDHGAVAVGP